MEIPPTHPPTHLPPYPPPSLSVALTDPKNLMSRAMQLILRLLLLGLLFCINDWCPILLLTVSQ